MSGPPLSYAAGPERRRFDWVAYVIQVVVLCLFAAFMTFAVVRLDRYQRFFEDFKLKLPPSTMLVYDIRYALRGVEPVLYLVPFLLPLLIVRLERRTQLWVTAGIMVLMGFAIYFIVVATMEPVLTLIDGISRIGGSK